mgnify:CR=1 FL=1
MVYLCPIVIYFFSSTSIGIIFACLSIIITIKLTSTFDSDIYIYIERKTSTSKLSKLGKKELLINNVLVLEIDKSGLLLSKKFFNKDDMRNIDFDRQFTAVNYSQKSFIYNFLSSLRQKIDDPLGKKRIKN